MAQANERAISTLTGIVNIVIQRVTTLEKVNDCINGVQVALERLTMESKYFGEKLDDLKKSIDRSNDENKKQHDELENRVIDLENKPGKKWEAVTWIVISGVVMGFVGFALAQFKVLGG